ncbi:MAG: Cardiolipin synthetase, partial [uncultured Nocardioides sp.]
VESRAPYPPVGLRLPGRARDRALLRRLLPPPGQEAEAVPGHAAADGRGGRGHADDVHLRSRPLRRHARRDRRRPEAGPPRDLHLEGRRDRGALQVGADQGRRAWRGGLLHLRRLRQPRRLPCLQALPVDAEGAALPRLDARAEVLAPARLRTRPPQDPGRRRAGRLRGRLQHRDAVRHRVARHPRPHHRSGGLGPHPCLRRLLEPQPAQATRPQRTTLAARGSGVRVGAPHPVLPQRATTVDVPHPGDVPRGHQPRHPQHLDDPRLLPARPGLRRRAQGRLGARGRRPAAGAAEVQPHRGRLDLARLLLPAARRRSADLPVQGRDGARQDVDHRRQLVDGGHGQRRPAQSPGKLRDQRRGHRRCHGRRARGDLPARPVELPGADQPGVGGTRPAPQVHRVRAGAAASPAL